MSDRTRLLERLARRNPVPQPAEPPTGAWDLTTVRLELMRRETEMDTIDQTPETRPGARPPNRGAWLVAAAAFAIVLVVGLVTFVGGGESPTPTTASAIDSTTQVPTTTTKPPTTTITEAPATTLAPTTTEAIDMFAAADQLMTAIYANDIGGIAAVASPRANLIFATYFAGFVEDINELANGEILGWTCSETAAANVIRCRVDYTEDMVRAAGEAKVTETWEIGFAFDGVQSAGLAGPEPDPLESATRAMGETHPEWFEPGGPCEGFFDGGDPSTCAPVWVDFILDWFAENG